MTNIMRRLLQLIAVFTGSMLILSIARLGVLKQLVGSPVDLTTTYDYVDEAVAHKDETEAAPDTIEPHTETGLCSHEMRARHLRDYCASRGTQEQLHEFDNGNFLVSPKHALVYCQISKASCTTWKVVLVNAVKGHTNMTSLNTRKNLMTYHNAAFLNKNGIKVNTAWKQSFQNFVKMIIVRHPLARVLSAYHNVVAKLTRKQAKALPGPDRPVLTDLRRHTGNSTGLLSLPEFVTYITNPSSKYYNDRHWLPMVDHCQVCALSYSYVLRLESIETDSIPILARLGFPVDFRLPRVHKSKTTGASAVHAYDQELPELKGISQNLLQALMGRYRDDFIAFGYEYDRGGTLATCRIRTNHTSAPCC